MSDVRLYRSEGMSPVQVSSDDGRTWSTVSGVLPAAVFDALHRWQQDGRRGTFMCSHTADAGESLTTYEALHMPPMFVHAKKEAVSLYRYEGAGPLQVSTDEGRTWAKAADKLPVSVWDALYRWHQDGSVGVFTVSANISDPRSHMYTGMRVDEMSLKKEADPHGKQPGELGAKYDAHKAPVVRGVLQYFPRAVLAVAEVSAHGAKKYAWNGWETVPDGVQRYIDALGRHIVYEQLEGPYDRDSKLLHAAHRAWNALAELELTLRELEKGTLEKKA